MALDVFRANKVGKTLDSVQKYFRTQVHGIFFSLFLVSTSFLCVFSYLCSFYNSFSNNDIVTLDGDKVDYFTNLRWSMSAQLEITVYSTHIVYITFKFIIYFDFGTLISCIKCVLGVWRVAWSAYITQNTTNLLCVLYILDMFLFIYEQRILIG